MERGEVLDLDEEGPGADRAECGFSKAEAHERDTTVKEVLSRALEAYFAERLETKAFAKLAESSFREWDDPRDADYDRL